MDSTSPSGVASYAAFRVSRMPIRSATCPSWGEAITALALPPRTGIRGLRHNNNAGLEWEWAVRARHGERPYKVSPDPRSRRQRRREADRVAVEQRESVGAVAFHRRHRMAADAR